MLSIKNYAKHYKNFDIEDISFDIPDGMVVGLIGENGAGKSTIIKSILGAVHPDGGNILFNGREILKVGKKERQQISFVLDDTGLPMELNLAMLDNVLSCIYDKWDSSKFRELVRQFALPEKKLFKDFSKGMKMKAAIAVALSYDSTILILDEPTSGLDPVVRDEILEMIYNYNKDGNRAVLLSSHITSDLEKICDYIVYMQVLIRRIRQVRELQNDMKEKDGKYYACGEVFISHVDARTRVQELKDEIFENAMDLVYTLCPVQNKDQPTWEEGARNLIFGLVLAFCEDCIAGKMDEKQLQLFNVYHNITKYCSEDTTALKQYLLEGRDEFSKVRGLVNTVLITSDKTLTSYLSEVNSYMQQLADDGILSMTSENDIDIANMDESPNALFVIVPDERFTRHRFVTLFLTQTYKELVEKANTNLRKKETDTAILKRRAYFILDEFGNLPKMENIEGMVTVGRSRGIRYLFVLQSFSQLNAKYTHLKMLESFFKIVLADAPVDVIELINNLVVETYERMGITENTDCSAFPADYFPLFSDLLETLQAKDKESMDSLTLRDMRTAELYLQKFVSGRYSDIWNAPSTLKTDANLIDFDFQSLFANKNNVVANAQMLLIFRFIEQEVINAREKNKGGANLHTLIIADEAHLYIDPKFPIALDFFYSMSKRIRKYNGSFIPATQNIADWNANEELRGKTSAIIKNSQYSFIFKLSAPDMKDVLDIYKAGDSFNDEEQRMIISAVTGQTFFVGSTELRNCILVKAGDYTQSLFEERKEEETD